MLRQGPVFLERVTRKPFICIKAIHGTANQPKSKKYHQKGQQKA